MIGNNIEDIIKVLDKKMLRIKMCFYGLICLMLGVFMCTILNIISLITGFELINCILFIICTLYPKINSYSRDVQSLKRDELKKLEGDILKVFKFDNSVENTWGIHVNSGNKEYVTFEIGEKVAKKLTKGDVINVLYTPNKKIIVSLKMVKKIVNTD